jgi:hypothetical protein
MLFVNRAGNNYTVISGLFSMAGDRIKLRVETAGAEAEFHLSQTPAGRNPSLQVKRS